MNKNGILLAGFFVAMTSSCTLNEAKSALKDTVKELATEFSDGIPASAKRGKKKIKITGPISKLKVSGGFKIEYIQARGVTEVTLEAPENWLDLFKITETRGTLKIEYASGLKGGAEVVLVVKTANIEAFELSGACELQAENIQTTQNIAIEASGSNDISFKKIVCASLKADLSGANELNWEGIQARSLKLSLSGANEAKLSGKCEEAKLEASGASEIDLSGLAYNELIQDLSGVSKVKTKK